MPTSMKTVLKSEVNLFLIRMTEGSHNYTIVPQMNSGSGNTDKMGQEGWEGHLKVLGSSCK